MADFSAQIGNSNHFSAQKQVVSRKKKRSSPKLSLIFRPNSEIQTFFQPKNRWSPKTKKKVFTEIEADFPNHDIYFTTSAPNFLWGGGVFNFSPKLGLKSTKNVRFCILHKPMGGLESPPPPPWLRYCVFVKTFIELSAFCKIDNI